MERNKNLWILVLAAVALLFLFGSFGMGGYGWWGFGIGFWFLCILFFLLFWGFIIWLIVILTAASKYDKNGSSDSLTILKRRYAKGGITKKQFERMKKEIN